MTIVVTTHYLEEAERLCDRVAILHEGEIVGLDTPEALTVGLGRDVLELRVDGDAPAALASLRARGIAGHDAFTVGSTLTIPLHDGSTPETLAALEGSGVPAGLIGVRRPTLDDVYLRLTGAQLAAAA